MSWRLGLVLTGGSAFSWAVMCLWRAAWLPGTDWSRIVSTAKTHLCSTCLSSASRQAQAHVKSGQVFKRESKSIKPSWGLSSEVYIFTSIGQSRTQCKPPFNGSESRIHFLMGAARSQMARAMDTEERNCIFARLRVSGISS